MGGMNGRGHVWQEECVWQGGMHDRGCAWQGSVWQGDMWGRGECMVGDMYGSRGYAWQGVYMAGGIHGRGYAWWGNMCGGGHVWQERWPLEFFTVCTKLAEMAILYSKDLTTAKKSYLQWGLTWCRDYCWFRSPVPNHMS